MIAQIGRADQQADERQPDAARLRRRPRRGDAGQEQQRVAGQEEADQEPGLGEQDDPHTDQPERPEQPLDVKGIQGQPVNQRAGLLDAIHG